MKSIDVVVAVEVVDVRPLVVVVVGMVTVTVVEEEEEEGGGGEDEIENYPEGTKLAKKFFS